jgi:hypothetical protein
MLFSTSKAANGTYGYNGDGGPAIDAQMDTAPVPEDFRGSRTGPISNRTRVFNLVFNLPHMRVTSGSIRLGRSPHY